MEQEKQPNVGVMTLIGKVLPTTLAGDKDNPLTVVAKYKLAPIE